MSVLIDSKLFKSEEYKRLISDKQKLLFIGLSLMCDDAGRLWFNPADIKKNIFPDEEVKEAEVEDLLLGMDMLGSIIIYDAGDNKMAIQMKEQFKLIRNPKKSKIPPPDDVAVQESNGTWRRIGEERVKKTYAPNGVCLVDIPKPWLPYFKEGKIIGYLDCRKGTHNAPDKFPITDKFVKRIAEIYRLELYEAVAWIDEVQAWSLKKPGQVKTYGKGWISCIMGFIKKGLNRNQIPTNLEKRKAEAGK